MAGHRLTAWSGGAILVLGALLVQPACSSDADRLDRAATEQAIEKVIESDLSQPATGVTCPDRIPRGEAKTIRCEVVLEGVDGPVRLEVEQVADDELDVTLLDAVIDPALLADELERQLLATYLRTFAADCGEPGFHALAPGSTVPCTVADDDGEREAMATVEDASGSLRFSVADPPALPDEPAGESEPSDGPATFSPGLTPTSEPSTGNPGDGD